MVLYVHVLIYLYDAEAKSGFSKVFVFLSTVLQCLGGNNHVLYAGAFTKVRTQTEGYPCGYRQKGTQRRPVVSKTTSAFMGRYSQCR